MTKHVFDIDLATKYGMDSAVILENLLFWTMKDKANNHNFYDGSYWIYNSLKAWKELFPYLSERAIRRILSLLENEGIIKTGNYNEIKYNKTKWYALTEKGLCICRNSHTDLIKTADGSAQNGKCNINTFINTNIITNINTIIFDFIDFTETEKKAIENWLSYRKEIKKNYKSQKSLDALKKELLQFKQDKQNIIMIIDKSMANGWTGLFATKGSFNNNERSHVTNCTTNEYKSINTGDDTGF